jgi:integrase
VSGTELSTTLTEVRDYLRQAKAANTLRAYRADWRNFAEWCVAHQRPSLPASPESLALYLTALVRTHRVSTLTRRLAAISEAHQLAACDSPTASPAVRLLMAGIRRAKGVAAAQKKPLLTADLERMIASLPPTLMGRRDAALLLIGFAGALRRSELVALNWEDVEFAKEGLIVQVRRSKTDPEGQGRKIAIPFGCRPSLCPVRALESWRDQAGGDAGPVFLPIDRHGNVSRTRLSDRAVARAVKRIGEACGLAPDDYAGHSLRAGFATAAAAGGASERAIMRQTGHRSLPILRRYIREGSLFHENAVRSTGL